MDRRKESHTKMASNPRPQSVEKNAAAATTPKDNTSRARSSGRSDHHKHRSSRSPQGHVQSRRERRRSGSHRGRGNNRNRSQRSRSASAKGRIKVADRSAEMPRPSAERKQRPTTPFSMQTAPRMRSPVHEQQAGDVRRDRSRNPSVQRHSKGNESSAAPQNPFAQLKYQNIKYTKTLPVLQYAERAITVTKSPEPGTPPRLPLPRSQTSTNCDGDNAKLTSRSSTPSERPKLENAVDKMESPQDEDIPLTPPLKSTSPTPKMPKAPQQMDMFADMFAEPVVASSFSQNAIPKTPEIDAPSATDGLEDNIELENRSKQDDPLTPPKPPPSPDSRSSSSHSSSASSSSTSSSSSSSSSSSYSTSSSTTSSSAASSRSPSISRDMTPPLEGDMMQTREVQSLVAVPVVSPFGLTPDDNALLESGDEEILLRAAKLKEYFMAKKAQQLAQRLLQDDQIQQAQQLPPEASDAAEESLPSTNTTAMTDGGLPERRFAISMVINAPSIEHVRRAPALLHSDDDDEDGMSSGPPASQPKKGAATSGSMPQNRNSGDAKRVTMVSPQKKESAVSQGTDASKSRRRVRSSSSRSDRSSRSASKQQRKTTGKSEERRRRSPEMRGSSTQHSSSTNADDERRARREERRRQEKLASSARSPKRSRRTSSTRSRETQQQQQQPPRGERRSRSKTRAERRKADKHSTRSKSRSRRDAKSPGKSPTRTSDRPGRGRTPIDNDWTERRDRRDSTSAQRSMGDSERLIRRPPSPIPHSNIHSHRARSRSPRHQRSPLRRLSPIEFKSLKRGRNERSPIELTSLRGPQKPRGPRSPPSPQLRGRPRTPPVPSPMSAHHCGGRPRTPPEPQPIGSANTSSAGLDYAERSDVQYATSSSHPQHPHCDSQQHQQQQQQHHPPHHHHSYQRPFQQPYHHQQHQHHSHQQNYHHQPHHNQHQQQQQQPQHPTHSQQRFPPQHNNYQTPPLSAPTFNHPHDQNAMHHPAQMPQQQQQQYLPQQQQPSQQQQQYHGAPPFMSDSSGAPPTAHHMPPYHHHGGPAASASLSLLPHPAAAPPPFVSGVHFERHVSIPRVVTTAGVQAAFATSSAGAWSELYGRPHEAGAPKLAAIVLPAPPAAAVVPPPRAPYAGDPRCAGSNAGLVAAQSASQQAEMQKHASSVLRKGNVLEIVPNRNTPPPVATVDSRDLSSSKPPSSLPTPDADESTTPKLPNAPNDTTTAPTTAVTPEVAEQKARRKAEREQRRLEKFMRREANRVRIQLLLAEHAAVAAELTAVIKLRRAENATREGKAPPEANADAVIGAAAAATTVAGESTVDDKPVNKFSGVPPDDGKIHKYNRMAEAGRSCIRRDKDESTETAAAVAEKPKPVVFADGIRPGDGTSDEEQNPLAPLPLRMRNKRAILRHLERQRSQRHEQRTMAAAAAAEAAVAAAARAAIEEAELENLPPPPPPSGDPPAHLPQPMLKPSQNYFAQMSAAANGTPGAVQPPPVLYFHYNAGDNKMYISAEADPTIAFCKHDEQQQQQQRVMQQQQLQLQRASVQEQQPANSQQPLQQQPQPLPKPVPLLAPQISTAAAADISAAVTLLAQPLPALHLHQDMVNTVANTAPLPIPTKVSTNNDAAASVTGSADATAAPNSAAQSPASTGAASKTLLSVPLLPRPAPIGNRRRMTYTANSAQHQHHHHHLQQQQHHAPALLSHIPPQHAVAHQSTAFYNHQQQQHHPQTMQHMQHCPPQQPPIPAAPAFILHNQHHAPHIRSNLMTLVSSSPPPPMQQQQQQHHHRPHAPMHHSHGAPQGSMKPALLQHRRNSMSSNVPLLPTPAMPPTLPHQQQASANVA